MLWILALEICEGIQPEVTNHPLELAPPCNSIIWEHMLTHVHVAHVHFHGCTYTYKPSTSNRRETHQAFRKSWDTLKTEGSGLSRCCQRERIRSIADLPPIGAHTLISGVRIRCKILDGITVQFMGKLKYHYTFCYQEVRTFIISSSILLARLGWLSPAHSSL